MVVGCVAAAAPWYVLVWARNGSSFWNEFFWKHHVERFFTPSLQHVQPFWYYIPVLLAALFPWTPLAGLLFRPKLFSDVKIRFLGGWLAFAFLFFSVARNKLPGYVLPLMPALAIVLAVAIEKIPAVAARWWLTASALLLIALPIIVAALPDALLYGVRRAPVVLTPGVPFLLIAPLVWWLAWREKATLGILAIGLAVMFGLAYVKGKIFPVLDSRVSVRQFWQANHTPACLDDSVRRDWEYGLNYYAARPLSHCQADEYPRIASVNGRLSIIGR
jgi:4-amino-4-deoxy-L-arabinose transferase-like glycosyltransferase